MRISQGIYEIDLLSLDAEGLVKEGVCVLPLISTFQAIEAFLRTMGW